MKLYIDTSLLVALLTNEAASETAADWLRAVEGEALTVSDWVVAEFSSAVSLKVRTGQIDEGGRSAARRLLAGLLRDSLDVSAIVPIDFAAAGRFCDDASLGLRASDALHLAVAARSGASLCTLDRVQAQAGAALGLDVQHIIDDAT